jgi:DNA polymerase-1
VGEAPGAVENYTRIPFSGPTGDLLWDICSEIGLSRNDVYVTNVCKYRPPGNQIKRIEEVNDKFGNPVKLESQIQQLWDEIHGVNPNIVVALGNTPLRALTGKDKILRWRGSVIQSQEMDFKVLASLHPAALLHSDENEYDGGKRKGPLKYSYRHVIKLDLQRAVRQSRSRLYEPPQRVLEVARDAVTVQRFFDLYADRTKYPIVSVDIESIKSIPYCIGFAFNNWHGISVPLIDIFSWINEDGIYDHEAAEMWRLCAELLDSGIGVIGQNFKYDQERLYKLCGMQVRNFYCDTSLLAHALHPEFPKSLEFNTSIYTEEPYYKDEGRDFDWRKDKPIKVLRYNARDACVTFEVFEEQLAAAQEMVVPGFPDWVMEFVIDHQMRLHNFYYEMEAVGFKVDHQKQKDLIKLYDDKIEESQGQLNALAGFEVNTASPKQVGIYVYSQLGYPRRQGVGEDQLVALMANTKKQTPAMRRALELILWVRRLKVAKTKIGRRCDYDGRMRTVFTICGTETGRSSTKIQQPPVRPTKMGQEFHTLTKHGELGTEVREMFIADDGYVIVETDMSQAEARIVALFGHDKRVLKLFADKEDVHRLTAAMIFGVMPVDVTKDQRFIGKMCRHAGNYDMGKHRLMELVNTEAKRQHLDINLSEWRASKILDAFHSFSPSVRKVFHADIIDALQHNNRVLVNPYGRYRQFFDRWDQHLWKEAYAHLPQSTVPDHLRRAGLRAKSRFLEDDLDARFVVEAHDALVGIVLEKDVDRYVQIMHEEIEVPIDFSRCTLKRGLLSIPAESKVGYTYKTCEDKKCRGCSKLHDYKIGVAA